MTGALAGAGAAAAVALLALGSAGQGASEMAAVLAALGALVLALEADRWLIAGSALFVTWLLSVLLLKHLPALVNPPPPVDQAVGGAALFDTPYRGAQFAAALVIAIPTVTALAAAVPALGRVRTARTRRAAVDADLVGPAAHAEVAVERVPLAVWIGAAVVAFSLVPDLRNYLEIAGGYVPYTWDSSNLTTWQLLLQQGLVPMKDFFYPYGFQWLFTLPSAGPVYQWLEQIALLALASWSLWRLSGGRVIRVLVCLLVLAVVGWWSLETWRYTPALLVPTTYAALGPAAHRRLGRGHLVFGAACTLAALVEADLLLLGLLGAALILVAELAPPARGWSWRRVALSVGLDAVPVIGAVLILALVWLATGTAAGNLRFFGDFTAVSSLSAGNEQVLGALGLVTLRPNAHALYVAIPALLVTAGFTWARWGRGQRGVGLILLGAGGASLGLLLKDLVRPIQDLMIVIPLVALSWSVILAWRWRSAVRCAAAGAAVAALLALYARQGGLSQYLREAVAAPAHVVRSVGVALDPGARTRAALQRLSAARFKGWPDLVVTDYYLTSVPPGPIPPFAIVGDSQLTYALLHQRPPYHVDLMNAGRLKEQRVMVRALERENPPYVIWRRDFYLDGVLYQTRDPVVFRWMIDNYVPVRVFPAVDILRRRRLGEPIPVTFWDSQLSAGQDLGYIPSLSNAGGTPRCSSGPGCVSYALVQGPARGGAAVTFHVLAGPLIYTVALRTRAGVRSDFVRLDRLFFWPFVGPAPRLVSLTPGFTVRLVGRRSGGNLY